MSEYLTRANKAYLDYKTSREKQKRKHREELEQFSEPYLIALGEAVNKARNSGHKIDEIMYVFGLKNRNFLYEALNAYLDSQKLDKELPELPQAPEDDTEQFTVSVLKLSGTKVSVEFWRHGEQRPEHRWELTVDKYGQVTQMPEQWLTDADERYREAVREAVLCIREEFLED